MDWRWFGWFFGFLLLAAATVVPVVRADAPECRASGTVVEFSGNRLVVESQNERMEFAIPAPVHKKSGQIAVGDRVTVIFDSPTGGSPAAREIMEDEISPRKQAPGQAPQPHRAPPVIDDRAYYPA